MTPNQLTALSNKLHSMDYPHTVVVSFCEGKYCMIKCRQELIPPDVVRTLTNAPDLNGVMTWHTQYPYHKQIVFTYELT